MERRTPALRWRRRLAAVLSAGLMAWVTGCGEEPDPADFAALPAPPELAGREPCAHRDARRMPLFGDLHVHTALSSDAWNYDLDVRPDGAYRYAFGGPIRLPPRGSDGAGTREVKLARPLDFAAVTDHAEFLGETLLCAEPGSEAYDSESCRAIRASTAPNDSPLAFKIMHPFPSREADVCGEDGERCNRALARGWREVIDAAERWYDRSAACERTTFVAYEYSSFRMGSNLHRNVIFRGSAVPRRPISYLDVQREWQLWRLLRDQCNASDTGCQALAIPHNSNISNGRMFAVDYPGAGDEAEQAARAALRIAMEPVVEIMQHKGDSECRLGVPGVAGEGDPLCDFEKFEDANFRRKGRLDPPECYDGPLADWKPNLGPSCLSRRSYVRYALVEGLAEEARIGVNPFKFGIMASTDTHNAMAGGVDERGWPGHLGIADGAPERRLATEDEVQMGNYSNGPGGLIGVWAEENSREAIFDAIRRKEVFGTSGPRLAPRFYAGWDLPANLCDAGDPVALAEAAGVPMGGDLPAGGEASGGGPVFALWATKDAGSDGTPTTALQRLQVIKGWMDDDGVVQERIVDVAGGDNDAGVDLATCTPQGPGHDALCGVWRDPDFDPARRAVYYARVVENPSCRYSTWQCLALEAAGEARPSGCDDDLMPALQQERAWTSPIWYAPASG